MSEKRLTIPGDLWLRWTRGRGGHWSGQGEEENQIGRGPDSNVPTSSCLLDTQAQTPSRQQGPWVCSSAGLCWAHRRGQQQEVARWEQLPTERGQSGKNRRPEVGAWGTRPFRGLRKTTPDSYASTSVNPSRNCGFIPQRGFCCSSESMVLLSSDPGKENKNKSFPPLATQSTDAVKNGSRMYRQWTDDARKEVRLRSNLGRRWWVPFLIEIVRS